MLPQILVALPSALTNVEDGSLLAEQPSVVSISFLDTVVSVVFEDIHALS